jgi:hypothetical protein
MKLVEDKNLGRLITVQFTEVELNTLYVAHRDMDYRVIKEAAEVYGKEVVRSDGEDTELYEKLEEILKGDDE